MSEHDGSGDGGRSDDGAGGSHSEDEEDLPHVAGTPGGSASREFEKHVSRDPARMFDDYFPAGSWAYGALGEYYVGKALNRLPSGWYITHDILIRSGTANLDHVVVGPPGVVVLNSKYHGEKPVVVTSHVEVAGRRWGHVERGEREAAFVSERLTRHSLVRVQAVSLIALVSFGPVQCTTAPVRRTVAVAHLEQVLPFLVRLPVRTKPDVVRRVARCVRDPHTWR